SGFGAEPGGASYRTMSPDEMREAFGSDDPFSDFFHTFFGGAGGFRGNAGRPDGPRGRAAPPPRGRDGEQPVDPTPDEPYAGSTLRLKIPEMTGTGRVFRLRGHGMPTVGKGTERGDLYATVDVQIPSQLSTEERKLYEQLRTLETPGR